MKILFVNADDFGYSFGVNRGIIEAHTDGIVTSTSVMVNSVAANEASVLKDYPNLAVGLHFVPGNTGNTMKELDEQVETFISITGDAPSHIDIHKVRNDDIELKNAVGQYAKKAEIPFRYSGKVNFIDSFFGPHADGDVSIERLLKSINETSEGLNELMCHVGYADEYLIEHSSYNVLREQELKSINSPEAMKQIQDSGITLSNWESTKS